MPPLPFDHAYLVCATPRSGSTVLCELLRATGRAGCPLEHFEFLRHSGLPRQPREYFDGFADEHTLGLLPPLQAGRPSSEAAEAWWERIAETGRTDNGIWGGKLMWGHVPDLLERARELPGLADGDLDSVLRRLLGDRATIVFITRRDKVAQAVSLWRAVQTQRWRASPDAEPTTPVYDFAGIDHLVGQLSDDEAAWSEWFRRTGREPLHLPYEDEIAPDPRAAAARVLRVLGLPEGDIPSPELSRQRDSLSADWAARYRAEHAGRSEGGRAA